MKRCPITYDVIKEDESYSQRGLHLLSPTLLQLKQLEYSAAEQRSEAIARAGKMSIQGVQVKLSAQLKVKEGCFEFVDQRGHYILKPQSQFYPELPENEAITMTLAASIGIDVPIHGLVYAKDGSMTYFIKRFDRYGHDNKLAVEDFAQLSQSTRDTKYNSSMEKVVKVINDFCSFPKIEAMKLLRLTLFNYLIGNEDMHLKNFSLITREQKILMSPAYDLLNTTIAQKNTKEELALPLNGKKNNIKSTDFLIYFAQHKLDLNKKVIADILQDIEKALPTWKELIHHSFLSAEMKKKYLQLLNERTEKLFNTNIG
ncbi:MAG: HipA domain-containing protein [Gammaproteobacteria bacterium]|nr:HipA domain-containing protein [Gammaproteobacteria bacterium]